MRGPSLRSIVAIAIVATAAISTLRMPGETHSIPVLLGTSGLVDGYNVTDQPFLKATWIARAFWLSDQGALRLVVRNTYLSDYPKTGEEALGSGATGPLTLIGSAILLQGKAVFVHRTFGGLFHYPLSSVVAEICEPSGGRTCTAAVGRTFNAPPPEAPYQKFSHIEIQLSWVRVFRGNTGSLFFQWLQSDSGVLTTSERAHAGLYGRFLAYSPIPEGRTRPLSEQFDYVAWLKANLPAMVLMG